MTPSESRFRLLVESVRDYAIFLLDADGNVESWNAGAQQIKGYLPAEIIGRPLSVFYTPPDVATGRPQRLLEAARTRGHVEDVGWRVRKDGTHFWADVVITALRDEHGRLAGYGKVTRDLTTRRAAEEALRQSEERMRLMIASVQDYALYMLDPAGLVTSWNPGAERIKGYRAEEIVGCHFSKFFPPEDVTAGKPDQELALARANGRFEAEAWRVRKDGTRFWSNVIVSPVRDGAGLLLGYTKITRDLTARRKSEDERVRLAQATEAVRLRDEFLSIASHELRTPLTALQLQLDLLKQLAPEGKLREKADRATRSGERMADLVDALLSVSRIATGKLELTRETFVLGDAAREAVERVKENADLAAAPITLVADPSVKGAWDRLRLEQVLINLLSNAIRYAPGAEIVVTVSRAGNQALMSVRDHGPGIPAGEEQRIFERFERGSDSMAGGLGLGLYIVRQIVEAHGGSVDVGAADGGGAVFTVRLPL